MIEDHLRGVIVNAFNDLLGDVHASLLDLPAQMSELAAAMRHTVIDDFRRLGLDLVSFHIAAITPPDEVQRRIDERTGMAILGSRGPDVQVDATPALAGDGETPALGSPQAGVGLDAGLGSRPTTSESGRETLAEPARLGQAGEVECPRCHAVVPGGSRFCPNCGSKVSDA
jgi:membrane protease subunit (stomatin/prohibitin family)